jgi:hypothetical protein
MMVIRGMLPGSRSTEAKMKLDEARQYFEGLIKSLRDICRNKRHKDPFVFLCGSAVIEYLSKLAAGEDTGATGYKGFVMEYMPAGYREFEYASGDQDLPVQMYHVLRCGIVHSFSLKAGNTARRNHGRDHSIGLSHDRREGHLANVSQGKAHDACCLNAHEFVEDIAKAMRRLFDKAEADPTLRSNIETWLQQFPPIQGQPTSRHRRRH